MARRRKRIDPLTLILLGKGRLQAFKPISCSPWRGGVDRNEVAQ